MSVIKNTFLFTMTAYPDNTGTIVHRPMRLRSTAGCDTAWNRTRMSVVMPQALRCSALDRCATQEPFPLTRALWVRYVGNRVHLGTEWCLIYSVLCCCHGNLSAMLLLVATTLTVHSPHSAVVGIHQG